MTAKLCRWLDLYAPAWLTSDPLNRAGGSGWSLVRSAWRLFDRLIEDCGLVILAVIAGYGLEALIKGIINAIFSQVNHV